MKHIFIPTTLAAIFCALNAAAAIYFRGKEVLRDGKAIVDVKQLYWAPSPDSAEKERIQGHLDINVDGKISSVTLVFQVFDTKGKAISAFSVTPQCCSEHDPSRWWRKRDWQDEVFPFCGVENSHIKIPSYVKSPKWQSEVEQRDYYKRGKNAWFYVDFPRDKSAQSMKVANVVIDDKEVQYTVRFMANKLLRYNQKSPEIKHGTEAELGDESECQEWLSAASDEKAPSSSGGGGNVSQSQQKGKAKASGARMGGSESRESEESALIAIPEESLRLDASSLVALRSGFTGKAYKCKALLDEFSAAIDQSSSNADERRKKLDDAVAGKIGGMLDKAQADGNLELALSLKSVLDSPLREGGWGDISELKALREAYAKGLARIDDELAKGAIAAAKTLNTALEEQKADWTKKGDLDVAKTIADCQKTLSAWAKDIAGKKPGGATGGGTRRPSTAPRPSRETLSPVEDARLVTIDATDERGNAIGTAKAGDEVKRNGENPDATDSSTSDSEDTRSFVQRITAENEARRAAQRAEEQTQILEFTAGEDNRGRAVLDFPDNKGKAFIKNDETEFLTSWWPRTEDSVWAYKDKLIGFNSMCHSFPASAKSFEKGWDFSQQCCIKVFAGQVFVLVNEEERFMAIKVISVRNKRRGSTKDEIVIEFKIY